MHNTLGDPLYSFFAWVSPPHRHFNLWSQHMQKFSSRACVMCVLVGVWGWGGGKCATHWLYPPKKKKEKEKLLLILPEFSVISARWKSSPLFTHCAYVQFCGICVPDVYSSACVLMFSFRTKSQRTCRQLSVVVKYAPKTQFRLLVIHWENRVVREQGLTPSLWIALQRVRIIVWSWK